MTRDRQTGVNGRFSAGVSLPLFCTCLMAAGSILVSSPPATGFAQPPVVANSPVTAPQPAPGPSVQDLQNGEQQVSSALPAISLDFLANGTSPQSLDQLRAMQKRVREVSDRVIRATVNIQADSSQGTGVIVSEDGYVLTAAHVIGRPNNRSRVVLQDGTRYEAVALGVNRDVDSGMLKIVLPENEKIKLPWIDLGQSADLPDGAWVVAVGHPGGLDPRRGQVVRVGRLLFANDGMMRTDCTLVGGDSGGPLVDMEGNLIGIHSRIGSSLWDNIHVPVDNFSRDWDRLALSEVIGGRPDPFIGIDIKPESTEISGVEKDGPADKAGLKVGDRILRIKDREISELVEVGRTIRRLKVGETVDVVVERDGSQVTVRVKIANR